MTRDPAVKEVEDQHQGEQEQQQEGGTPRPPLKEIEAPAQQVADQDRCRDPDGTSEGVVEEEGPPVHPAYAGHQRHKDPQARDEPDQKNGLPPVTLKEPLRSSEALGRYQGVPTP